MNVTQPPVDLNGMNGTHQFLSENNFAVFPVLRESYNDRWVLTIYLLNRGKIGVFPRKESLATDGILTTIEHSSVGMASGFGPLR